MANDADELVIEIPSDSITMEIDKDGLPKTVPVQQPETPAETNDPVPTLAELQKAQKERDDLARRAEQAERDATERGRALTEAQTAAETERRGRTEAERTAHERTINAATAHYYRVNSELQAVENNITSLKGYMEQAELNLQNAIEGGDAAKQARAQRDLAKAAADLGGLEQVRGQWSGELDKAKRAYDQLATQAPQDRQPAKKEDREEQPQQRTAQTHPDEWISQYPRKTTGAWLQTHKDFVTDPAKHQKLMDFASEWYNDGNQLHSKDFIKALDQEFGFAEREEAPVTTEQPKREAAPVEERQKAKTAPAAPVSRDGSYFSSGNMNASKIKLPADVVAFCKASGLDPSSYALSVVEEIKRGEKPKEWLDPGYDRGIR